VRQVHPTNDWLPKVLITGSLLADLGLFRIASFFGFQAVQLTPKMASRLTAHESNVIRQVSYDSRTLRTIGVEMQGYKDSLSQIVDLKSKSKLKSDIAVVVVTPSKVDKPPVGDLGITQEQWEDKWHKNQVSMAISLNKNVKITEDALVVVEKELSHVELCCSDSVLTAIQSILDANGVKVKVAIGSSSI
jgi:hypothetical protein